jgi:hypothetical protein
MLELTNLNCVKYKGRIDLLDPLVRAVVLDARRDLFSSNIARDL